jgi:hypothetical protein
MKVFLHFVYKAMRENEKATDGHRTDWSLLRLIDAYVNRNNE